MPTDHIFFRHLLLTSALVLGGSAVLADDAALRESAREPFASIPAPADDVEAARIELGTMPLSDPACRPRAFPPAKAATTWGLAAWTGSRPRSDMAIRRAAQRAVHANAVFNVAQF
jgi:hypothetical protein